MVFRSPCALHVPHKEWSDDPRELDNYRHIENWAMQFPNCFPPSAPTDLPLLNALISRYPAGYWPETEYQIHQGSREQIPFLDRALLGGVERDPTENFAPADGMIYDPVTGQNQWYTYVMGYTLPPATYKRLEVNIHGMVENIANGQPGYDTVTPGTVELVVYQNEYPWDELYHWRRVYTTPQGSWYGSAGLGPGYLDGDPTFEGSAHHHRTSRHQSLRHSRLDPVPALLPLGW
jgi:hypothetical protein